MSDPCRKCTIREVMGALAFFPASLLLGSLGWSLLHANASLAGEIHRIVLQDGIYSFNSRDSDGECAAARKACPDIAEQYKDSPFWGRYFAAVCAKKNASKCVCDADIAYPTLAGDPGSEAVNAAFKKIADGYACSKEMAITKLHYEEPFRVAHIISVKFDGYERTHGGQGACHSQVLAITANSETGHVYTLAEVLDREQEAGIRNSIVAYVTTYFLETPSNENAELRSSALRMLQNDLDRNFWTSGFYLRDRQLFVDLNDYILGCSEGPSFAVPIPARYIVNRAITDVLRRF